MPISVAPQPDPELARLKGVETRLKALLAHPGAITRAALRAVLVPQEK